MRGKYVSPSASLTAFSCPHCGTLAPQRWLQLHGNACEKTPSFFDAERVAEAEKRDAAKEDSHPPEFWDYFKRAATQVPFAERSNSGVYAYWNVANLHLSVCNECDELGIWKADQLLWPSQSEAPPPNVDLPNELLRDYQEAAEILSSSPRGAAALLRLCLQKLCGELLHDEGGGKHIDSDIRTLVAKGLDVRVQRALDIVRVVGNEAVHPGTMDISDDRATAEELFRLLNLIVEVMITQPKHIEEMYGKLPEGKRKAIEQRDAPRLPAPDPVNE